MKRNEIPIETILIGLIILGVFAAVFLFSTLLPKATDTTVQGVRVVANGDAQAQLKSIVSANDPVLFDMQLFEGNSSKNSILAIATAQIAANLVRYNRAAFVYGSIDGNASINCVSETNFCTGAAVTMKIGEFGGMRINDTHVVIEGTQAWYDDARHLEVLAGLFGQAAA